MIQSMKMADDDGNESHTQWRTVAWRKEKVSSKEKSTTEVQVQHQEQLLGRRENLTLIFCYVYHVINNTYIHIIIERPNIYMYKMRKYTKNP
jgi:hypothetical protein